MKNEFDRVIAKEVKAFKKDIKEIIHESKNDTENMINSLAFYCFLLTYAKMQNS